MSALNRRGLVAVLVLFAVSARALRADDLYWIDGSSQPTLTRYDLANKIVVSSTQVTNLALGERIVGWTPPAPLAFSLGPKNPFVFTEDPDSLEHRARSIDLGTAAVKNAGILKEDTDVIGSARGYVIHGSGIMPPIGGTTGQIELRLAINEDADFFKPGGVVNTAQTGAKKQNTQNYGLDSVIAAGKTPNGFLLLLTEKNGGPAKLVKFFASYSPGIVKTKPVQLATISVTYPGQGTIGSQILGFTMGPDHQVYALVNKVGSWIGHGWGDIVLCRGNIVGGKLALTQVAVVQSWFNGGIGALSFEPFQMLLEKT